LAPGVYVSLILKFWLNFNLLPNSIRISHVSHFLITEVKTSEIISIKIIINGY